MLPISVEHALAAAALPTHHADMFDRVMVAQAEAQLLVLATANEELRPYGVPLMEAAAAGES
jgi:PIN domain nuclease of toxin-antitoxin system